MKKLLLTLGAIASVATPVAAVVACGATPAKTDSDALAKALATTKATDKAEVEGSLLSAAAKKAAEDKIDAAKDLQELTEVNSLFEAQEATAKSKDEAAKAAEAAAAKAPQYKGEVAKLQKENTEKFAGKDITWAADVDATILKDGMILEIDYDGVKQLVEVVNGQWSGVSASTMAFDGSESGITLKTEDGSYMGVGSFDVSAASKTSIKIGVHNGMPGPFGTEHKTCKVTRIGSVK